jgi:hypothetical protein
MVETTKPGVVNPIAEPVTDAILQVLQAALDHLGADLQLTQASGYMGAMAVQHGKGIDGIVFFNERSQADSHQAAVTGWWKRQLDPSLVGPGTVEPHPEVDPEARMVWSQPPWGTGKPLPAARHATAGR